MGFLYRNAKGYPVQSHSYSGGSEYSECPKKYDYSRRKGWKEKERRASSEFGNAVEAVIQYYHGLTPPTLSEATAEWERLWLLQKENPELSYSDKDGDWESMNRQGIEMITLYVVVLPKLPIKNPVFQVNYKKELYPDTEYAGLQFTSFVDMQTVVEGFHPMLPKSPENERTVIIDIKTAANPYSYDPRMSSMDPQLRSYSWVSGHNTVAFLVFVKRSTEVEKGDIVTLTGWYNQEHTLGDELVVLKVESNILTLIAQDRYEQYKANVSGLRGKALKEATELIVEKFGFPVQRNEVVKQRIQFLPALISDEERQETGEVIGQQAIEISRAEQRNFFPKRPGVRFPNNHCAFCPYLGLCINDDRMVQAKLVNILLPEKPKEKDWLEEI